MAVKTERKLSTPFAKYCCLTRFGARHCNSMFTTVSAADLQCLCVSSDRLTSVYRYEFSMGKWFPALSWAMVLHSCCCMHHVPHETSQSLAVSSAMCTRIPPSNLARGQRFHCLNIIVDTKTQICPIFYKRVRSDPEWWRNSSEETTDICIHGFREIRSLTEKI